MGHISVVLGHCVWRRRAGPGKRRGVCGVGRRANGEPLPCPSHGWHHDTPLLRPSLASGEPCSPRQLGTQADRTAPTSSVLPAPAQGGKARGRWWGRRSAQAWGTSPAQPRTSRPRPARYTPLCVSVRDCGEIMGLGQEDLATNPGPRQLCHIPWCKVVKRVYV